MSNKKCGAIKQILKAYHKIFGINSHGTYQSFSLTLLEKEDINYILSYVRD